MLLLHRMNIFHENSPPVYDNKQACFEQKWFLLLDVLSKWKLPIVQSLFRDMTSSDLKTFPSSSVVFENAHPS